MFGILRSSSVTSGRNALNLSRHSLPSLASATTRISGWLLISPAKPDLINGWSSTTNTVMTLFSLIQDTCHGHRSKTTNVADGTADVYRPDAPGFLPLRSFPFLANFQSEYSHSIGQFARACPE